MLTSSHASRCFVALLLMLLGLDLVSCSDAADDDADAVAPVNTPVPLGRAAQALTDTDGDTMDDGWEVTYFGNLSATSAADADTDGMTNGEEYQYGFVPNVNDGFADADGDRYPNVFEVRSGSDPNNPASIPTPTYVVNGAGGGTHTTISAALTAANAVNGAYQIIGVAPGVYTGAANLTSVSVASTKPKLLFIGLEGAAETIIDGGRSIVGWVIQNNAVVSSLTFRNAVGALRVESPAKEVRFVDLMVRDNTATSTTYTSGLHVRSNATGVKVYVVGSTFLDNAGAPTVKQINIDVGAATIVNTLVWSQTTGTMLAKAASATLATNNCLVKGQTLTGTGNLSGSTDPKLRADGHLLWDSPLRVAGGTVAQSRIDMDGDLRPSGTPDIGVDQFNDSDGDELADQWEVEYAGNLTTLTGRSQEWDGDGLSNEGEYANATNPTVADTDVDGISDGDEVLVHGSNPLSTDTDRDDMPDGWEIPHGLSSLVVNTFDDDDGDRYPNIYEYAYSTDPSDRASIPTPTYVVNGAGGGTHTTISAALGAANVANGAYQIIGIAPGVYTGAANLRDVSVASTKPKLLFIGLQGAVKTIIDGGNANYGWLLENSAVVSSLTFRNTLSALWVESPAKEVRLVDLMVRDNTATSTSYTAGLHVRSNATGVKVYVVGSTFLDNTGGHAVKQINFDVGAATVVNTVVWSQTTGTMLAKAAGATLATNNCLVKGQTLTGTGNLAGSTDPKLRADGHVLWDSPLRAAGGTVAQSRIDVDGDLRPSTTPDIGFDQFNDSDSDQLADAWEVEYAGNLTTLTGRSQEVDGDGLSNEGEYANATNPVVADTDVDGVSDGDEVLVHGSNPLSTDTDRDDMPDGWEIPHGLSSLVANTFEDADGDRYPNVYEYNYLTDPSDRASIPTPTYVVNGAGGGTHTTISAALGAANVANGAYQIIGIAPGVYTGAANLRDVSVASTKPKLLFIGLQGAVKTIIDGGNANYGWLLENSAVVSSLTFRNTLSALWVESPAREVRFVDLMVRDNTATSTSYTAGLHVRSNATGVKVYVVGSTFLDNTGGHAVKQINFDVGAATVVNTVVWSQTTGTMLAKAAGATLVTNNCLVKNQTLTGTGNLAGSTDPKLRADGHVLWDSPLRAAGGTVAQSRIDVDGDLRPSTTPDIGFDQFNDSDSDQLADAWEVEYAGDLTTLTGRSQEGDGDGLSNEGEYANATNPVVDDTDGDGVSDGDEVLVHGSNPLSTDTDRDDMPDGWEVLHGLSSLVVNTFEDADGDRYPNVYEYTNSTDPNDRASIPTPTYVVNGAGGGTHTTISAALGAANVANGAYQIIGIAPGVYTGAANLRDVSVASTKPKLLFIGLQGALKTIIDGGNANYGWLLENSAVVSSLTFRNTLSALWVESPAREVRFVDLVVRDNTATSTSYTAGLHVRANAAGVKVYVVGSAFLGNTGGHAVKQINIEAGAATIVNTLVWSQTTGTMLAKAASATLATNNCLVKGQTLTGTGNLAGSTDPKLRADGHLLWDSPLRVAGGTVAQSRIDMDGDLRPSGTPDIGVDQFNDSDGDELADQWEVEYTGNLTTLTGRSQDADGDGLSNEGEYANAANPTVADTDVDGISDGDEVLVHGSNPLSTDTDGDGMPDGWEIIYGLTPLVSNIFEDADGDRYPNVYEYTFSTDPSDRASIPTPTYVVNGAGGGTHTTISAALTAAVVANGAYQIIGIAPGVYTGAANLSSVTVASTKPKLLFIGLAGAADTVIDGAGTIVGWTFQNSAVVSSLTFRDTVGALSVEGSAGKEVRFVDLIVRDNTTAGTDTPGLQVASTATGAKVYVVGSTFLDNIGAPTVKQINISAGAATIVNTVVWSQTSGTMLAKASGATLTTNNCLVKGQTLAGTGNLAGDVDPKLRFGLRLAADSPLRGAGASVPQSRIDMDGELRPSPAPDIGVDQFSDPDSDGLPDAWEVATVGNTTTMVGSGDDDDDGLTNAEEYDWGANWLDPDTDSDGVMDGLEVEFGTDPLVADADEMAGDLNEDGLIDSIGAQLGYQPNELDSDGDGVSNADETLMGTSPVQEDSDGDGVPDGTDAFALDPLMSTLPSDPLDVEPPVITLTAPWYAVEQ